MAPRHILPFAVPMALITVGVIIQQNDVLIGLGSRAQLDRLDAIADGLEPRAGLS